MIGFWLSTVMAVGHRHVPRDAEAEVGAHSLKLRYGSGPYELLGSQGQSSLPSCSPPGTTSSRACSQEEGGEGLVPGHNCGPSGGGRCNGS